MGVMHYCFHNCYIYIYISVKAITMAIINKNITMKLRKLMDWRLSACSLWFDVFHDRRECDQGIN